MRRIACCSLVLLFLLATIAQAQQQPELVRNAPALPNHSPDRPAAEKLLEQKIAELARLQREVDALRQQLGRDQQILIQVQAVRVSLTRLHELGLDTQKEAQLLATLFGVPASNVPVDELGYGRLIVERARAESMIKTFKDKHVLTVLAEPSIVTTNNRPAYFFSGEDVRQVKQSEGPGTQPVEVSPALKIGTQVDVVAVFLGHNQVQLDVRPRISRRFGDTADILQVAELDAHIEMELGKTMVMGGLRQTNFVKKFMQKDTAEETAVYFLVSPELIDAQGTVTRKSGAQRR